MPIRRLTDPTIQRLAAKPGERVDYTDYGHPGLTLRVTGTADQRQPRRTWTFTYRIDGRQRRMTLGTAGAAPGLSLADARAAADAALALVRAGTDPQEARAAEEAAAAAEVAAAARAAETREAGTVAAVVERYLKHMRQWGRSDRHIHNIGLALSAHVLSRWAARDLRSITRREVVALLKDVADKGSTVTNADGSKRHLRGGKIAANRVGGTLRAIFRFAADESDDDDEFTRVIAPIQRIKAQYPEPPRKRVLTTNELRTLWANFTELDHPYGTALKIMLVTGQRRSEVCGARWADIDLEERTWTLQAHATKSDRSTVVPLSKLAIEILASLPRVGPFVFAGAGGKPITGYSQSKAKLARLPGADSVAPWHFHDLRRTCATELGKLGTPEFVISKVLNHASTGITGRVYNLYEYLAEKRTALEAWAAYLTDLTTPPTPANVANLNAARERRHAAQA